MVSKAVKQQEDINKKCRQKLTDEEAFERKQDKFLKPLKKTIIPQQMSTVPMIEYTPKKLQMIKDFRQMTEQKLEDIG